MGTSRVRNSGAFVVIALILTLLSAALPSSGGDASKVVDAENGAQLAIDEANASNLLPGY